MKGKPLWLLLSDIHFKPHDLDRITRAADWVASVPNGYNISRAVICGDLLTTRTSQSTHVLSACYRFLNKLAGAVPHVNILLGNHDLAYRFDYTTSALEALAINRLAPFVTLHTEVGCHEWDGRKVLVMPFREDQSQIIRSIHELDPKTAAATVGFAHLAINRAITQKHIINAETGKPGLPSRYPGLTSPDEFAPLARTFTGHFHSHQTILQATSRRDGDLKGSITYIGAPLQLTWADLFDTEKGVILLDPETLKHKLVHNPYALGYTTVEAQVVLSGKVDPEQVHNKHVMVTGKISKYKYILARDSLVKLGVRSVRDWKAFDSEFQLRQMGLGKTMLPADSQNLVDRNGQKTGQETKKTQTPSFAPASAMVSPESITENKERKPIDLGGMVQEYVSSLDLGSSLENRQDLLTVVGKRFVEIGSHVENKTGDTIKYREIIDRSTPLSLITSKDSFQATTPENMFNSYPIAIEITNFLGVQSTISLDFKHHFQPGMNFVVGQNGAGKSTIIEAIVWCQFGQCIREGLGVNDVINDVTEKDCNVRLTFANGYTISRFRKHSEFRNRVLVEKDGVVQPEFEGPSARDTQDSIDRLLGIDFDTFIRTILLGNESTRSFLSASPLQRRQLMETALGLGVLDGCAEACSSMLSQVDEELRDKQTRLKEVTHTMIHLKRRGNKMEETLRRLHDEQASLANKLQRQKKKQATSLHERELKRDELLEILQTERFVPDLQPDVLSLQRNVSQAQNEVEKLGLLVRLPRETAVIKELIITAIKRVYNLREQLELLLEENNILEPFVEDEKDVKREESSSGRGFLTRLVSIFRGAWVAISNMVVFGTADPRKRWYDHMGTIATLTTRITEIQTTVIAIKDRATNFTHDISRQKLISESDVHTVMGNITVQEASNNLNQLTAAIERLKALTDQYNHLQREQESRKQKRVRKQQAFEEHEKEMDIASRDWKASLDRYHILIDSKGREITTYKQHLDSDAESLVNLDRQATDLSQESAAIQSHREIFAFWQSAFTRRHMGASKVTFRRHVIERHLGELNKLLGQILMIMYQDAHYARSVTNRTIGALFQEEDEEDDDDGNNDQESASPTVRVLDPSLSINPALAYAKKSGGERKRVDLALFFALFMMGEARSAHMARYMLVDEAFDSLDVAGQTSVLKWCRWMTERLAYVLVITHNRSLIGIADEEGSAEGTAGVNVVTLKTGDKGTELAVNGD